MKRLIINTLPSTGTIVQQMFKVDYRVFRNKVGDSGGDWGGKRTGHEIGQDIYNRFLNKTDCLCSGQVPYTPGIVDLITQMDIRMILVTRDPRDLFIDYIGQANEEAVRSTLSLVLPYFQEFIEWMRMPDRVLRVAIEDLRVAPLSGARRIREFAGDIVPRVSASQLVSRVSSYRANSESVKRADLPVYVKDIFKTPEFKALIRAFGYNP